MGGLQHRINENKYMVTDNAIYIGKTLALSHTYTHTHTDCG